MSQQEHIPSQLAPLPPAEAPPQQVGIPFAIPAIAAAPPPNVLDVLQTLISRQADAMEWINTNAENTLTFQKEKETKKKDHFKIF
jgi:hypothetical protein